MKLSTEYLSVSKRVSQSVRCAWIVGNIIYSNIKCLDEKCTLKQVITQYEKKLILFD